MTPAPIPVERIFWSDRRVWSGITTTRSQFTCTWQASLTADHPRPVMVRRQLLHWSVLLLAILLVYLMLHFTDLDVTHSGFIALLLFATTTMLAGVHFWWRFAILGLILAATLVASVLVEHFFVALLVLSVLVVILLLFFRRRENPNV